MPNNDRDGWGRPDQQIVGTIREMSDSALAAYRVNPTLVREHASIERATAQGAYGRRQIYELVQNGADALLESDGDGGRIHVLLTQSCLYCANEGLSIDAEGIRSILSSHISMKRGAAIGHFGLGFKSVLGVTDQPQFYSRVGSFAFDKESAQRKIESIVPNEARYPILRVAEIADPLEAASQDAILADLMSWATTIIKLPLDQHRARWLGDDVEGFPREFMLFSPHVGQLILEDVGAGEKRVIDVSDRDGVVRLAERDDVTEWKVFRSSYFPSSEALEDAGELEDRDKLPIVWAVPMQRTRSDGTFWAFFPTDLGTTLSGILNAPWKTNEDRQSLLRGVFNEELMAAAAVLVVKSARLIGGPEDPCRFLDLFPARGRETRSWGDEVISEAVYRAGRRAPSLPDSDGNFRRPEELKLYPEGMPASVLIAWSESRFRAKDWCHVSADLRNGRERRPRVNRLMGVDPDQDAGRNASEWIEELARSGTPQASAEAIRIALLLAEDKEDATDEVESARIVLCADGSLAPARRGTVFLPLSGVDMANAELTLVSEDLLAIEGAAENLRRLGLTEADASAFLEGLMIEDWSEWENGRWADFWAAVRHVGFDCAVEAASKIAEAGMLRVRTLSGDFKPIEQVLLPSNVVPADGSRDAEVTVDLASHEAQSELLLKVGAADVPVPVRFERHSPGFWEYVTEARRRFVNEKEGNPQTGYLRFAEDSTIGPLGVLDILSPEGKTLWTEALLLDPRARSHWIMRHSSAQQADKYGDLEVESPAMWTIRRNGLVETSQGSVSPGASVGTGLRAWSSLLPVARNPAVANALGLPETASELTLPQWGTLFEALLNSDYDEELTGDVYARACEAGVKAPSLVACSVGPKKMILPPNEVHVVADSDYLDSLAVRGTPAVLVRSGPDADRLERDWGIARVRHDERLAPTFVPSGEQIHILDHYPRLRYRLPANLHHLTIQRCSVLSMDTPTPLGLDSREARVIPHGAVVYVADDVGEEELLDDFLTYNNVEIPEEEIATILEESRRRTVRDEVRAVRREPTLPKKLLRAVGADGLRSRMPRGVFDYISSNGASAIEDELIGQMFLAVHGTASLSELAENLSEHGFEPPRRWSGSTAARAFVRDMGFPEEYAGARGVRRDRFADVPGPVRLPPLHTFQEEMSAEVITVLRNGDGQTRGLVELPTGSGKTRVVVESIVKWLIEDEPEGPILWVAQTDELCEQAVETWREIWSSAGREQETLRVSRHWANNEATPTDTAWHVVVATINKLQSAFQGDVYGWLSEPACLVIDEAHHSTTPMYTDLLDWLGLGRGKGSIPMLGLTATAYRGENERETRALASRYGQNKLRVPSLDPDAYSELQRMKVLCSVDHESIEGSEIELSEDELKDLGQFGRLPGAAADRLGRVKERNERILEKILGLDDDWPTLVFATSVENSRLLAAVLKANGVSAAVVAGDTDAGARRFSIEGFRAGDIQVLVNFGVLTTGFDAPATRVVVVTRPVYSPGLYQQMIGRGLRGPLNGGKERCLIIDVEDNVNRFEGQLAFNHFVHLWANGEGA